MLLTTTLFYIFTTLSILSSVFVVFSRNPIFSVLFLIFSFFNVSCILFLFNFEFLPVSFLVIYAGIFIAYLFNFYFRFVLGNIDKNSVIHYICVAFLGMSVLLFNANIEAYCTGLGSNSLITDGRSCESQDKYSWVGQHLSSESRSAHNVDRQLSQPSTSRMSQEYMLQERFEFERRSQTAPQQQSQLIGSSISQQQPSPSNTPQSLFDPAWQNRYGMDGPALPLDLPPFHRSDLFQPLSGPGLFHTSGVPTSVQQPVLTQPEPIIQPEPAEPVIPPVTQIVPRSSWWPESWPSRTDIALGIGTLWSAIQISEYYGWTETLRNVTQPARAAISDTFLMTVDTVRNLPGSILQQNLSLPEVPEGNTNSVRRGMRSVIQSVRSALPTPSTVFFSVLGAATTGGFGYHTLFRSARSRARVSPENGDGINSPAEPFFSDEFLDYLNNTWHFPGFSILTTFEFWCFAVIVRYLVKLISTTFLKEKGIGAFKLLLLEAVLFMLLMAILTPFKPLRYIIINCSDYFLFTEFLTTIADVSPLYWDFHIWFIFIPWLAVYIVIIKWLIK